MKKEKPEELFRMRRRKAEVKESTLNKEKPKEPEKERTLIVGGGAPMVSVEQGSSVIGIR